MPLTAQDRQLLKRRKTLVGAWPIAGTVLLIGPGGFAAWLCWTQPLLVNPDAVLARLDDGFLPASTLSLMAVFLPIAVWMCVVLGAAVILVAFGAVANEKRHMAIIEKLASSGSSQEWAATRRDGLTTAF
jgi:hypothetical protein